MAAGGLSKSLKKALLVFVLLLLCSPKPATGYPVQKSLQKAVVAVALLATKPVIGSPMEWWRVRVWEGKFYYIYRSGYYEALSQWEVESLEEAFVHEPEMSVFIVGQSQMNWGEVSPHPPFWEVESQQWADCLRTPHSQMQLAKPIDLWQLWPGPKPERGYWKEKAKKEEEEEEENASRWQCKWENDEAGDPEARSSTSRPARGQSRGRSPSKPAKGSGRVPWSQRYLSRGFHSQMRREERERVKAEGKPVPPHLQVQQVMVCKELKKQMWELQQRSRQNARAPEPAEAEENEKPEEADVPMPAPEERGRSRGTSIPRGKMGPRSVTPNAARGTPAQPVRGSFLKEEPEEEEEEECEDENPEETQGKPEEALNKRKNKPKKRKKPVQAEEQQPTPGGQDNADGGGGVGGDSSKPPEEPPLPAPDSPPDYGNT